MPDIWALMRAIRGSDLPPTDRHIVMTLASLADPETGSIPDRFMPSLSELAKFTGLGRSTVARRLPFIEDAGWVKHTAPSVTAAWRDKERNSYHLSVPSVRIPAQSDGSMDDAPSTSPTAGLVPEGDQSQGGTSPTAGPVLVPERERTSPTAGLEVPNLRTKRTNTPPSEVMFDVSDDTIPPPDVAKPRKQPAASTANNRPDIDEICTYLVDAVVAGGSKKPSITEKWRTEARLLLDEQREPKATVDKVKALIDWIQQNDWWKPRVLAMPKLRSKYDEIRLDAVRDFKRKQEIRNGQLRSSERYGHQPYRNPVDESEYEKPL